MKFIGLYKLPMWIYWHFLQCEFYEVSTLYNEIVYVCKKVETRSLIISKHIKRYTQSCIFNALTYGKQVKCE